MHVNIDTLLAGLGGVTDESTGGLVPAIHMGVTHTLPHAGAAIGYARGGPVGGTLFERIMVGLDRGAAALGFSSGASAAQAIFAALPAGSHVILEAEGYYEFRGILKRAAVNRGIALPSVDLCDAKAGIFSNTVHELLANRVSRTSNRF